MYERIALITGGTSGIGKETAVKLAQNRYSIVIVGRHAERGQAALAEIQRRSNNPNLRFIQADMSLMQQVQQLASEFSQHYHRLDILIHSAGVIHTKRIITSEGLEASFTTDYLSRFFLTKLLLDLLKAAAPARVVNVAAAGTVGKIDFADLLGERQIGGLRGLGQAQFANDIWTLEIARRIPSTEITFTALQPGAVDTAIRREFPELLNRVLGLLFKPLTLTAEEGAVAPYYLATAPEVAALSGALFQRTKLLQASKQTADPELGQKLWEISEQLIQSALKEQK